jgi:hypothetical protein
LKEPAHGHHGEPPVRDMNIREFTALAPICVLCLVLGVYPQPLLKLIDPNVTSVTRLYDKIREQIAASAQGTAEQVLKNESSPSGDPATDFAILNPPSASVTQSLPAKLQKEHP